MPEPGFAVTNRAVDGLTIQRIDLGRRLIGYDQAWQLQREVHAAVVDGSQMPTLLLLEHQEIFTAGKRTQSSDRPTDGSVVIDVDRGGRITWHGPGQLVCYPIIPLPHPLDVVAHVRRMETAIIATCADFGIQAERVDGRSGVWCPADGTRPARKIGAIGVRVASGVTMHGLALNVDCDLQWAQRIVPCGIPDAGITSIAAELADGPVPGLLTVSDSLESHLLEVFVPTLANATA